MSTSFSKRAAALAGRCVLLALASLPAQAHTIVGNRIFPATLAIDDPGVNDELTLPAFSYLTAGTPDGSAGPIQYGLGWEYSKTLTPMLAISVGSEGYQWQKRPNASGWANIETQLKGVIWQDARSESIVSTGFSVEWANTGSPQSASLPSDPYTTVTGKLFAGKGFGDAPWDWARPFALTAELDAKIPTQTVNADGSQNPTTLSWGATLQYSLLYMNSFVRETPAILRNLIPTFEADFSTPIAHVDPTTPGNFNNNATTGVVGPALYYIGKYFQLGVMAQIPINSASGQHVGVMASVDFYLDDIFPNSLGKPLFSAPVARKY